MPRYARLFLPGMLQYIVQRGHDRNAIFVARNDYRYFLDNIVEARHRFDVEVHSLCLMNNYVHPLVSPGPESNTVSAFMRMLAARQTRYVNHQEHRTDTLWEGRFNYSFTWCPRKSMPCCRWLTAKCAGVG